MKRFFGIFLVVVMILNLTACSTIDNFVSNFIETINNGGQTATQQYNGKMLFDAKLSDANEEIIKETLSWYTAYKSYFRFDDMTSEDSSSLYGILGHPLSVNYSMYPVMEAKDIWAENEVSSILQKNGYSFSADQQWGLYEFDKESVYWIAQNIFNMSKSAIDDLIENELIRNRNNNIKTIDDIFVAKGSDGKDKYYRVIGGLGTMIPTIDLTWIKTDGKKYYFKYDSYSIPTESIFQYIPGTLVSECDSNQYAIMEKKQIDGKEYWTVYKITEDIPEDIFTQNTPKAFTTIKGEYEYGYTDHLTINDDGTFSGRYYHTSGVDGETYTTVLQYSEYTGKLTEMKKKDKYTYTAKVSNIQYKHKTGTESINTGAGIKTEYVSQSTINDGDIVTIYVKGTPVGKLSAECKELIRDSLYEPSYTGLLFNVIDSPGKCAFTGVETVSRKELDFNNERKIEFDWGWELFNCDSTINNSYNSNLAKAAIYLCEGTYHGRTEANNRMQELGFTVPQSTHYIEDAQANTSPMTIASRLVKFGKTEYLIVFIAIRGSQDSWDFITDIRSGFLNIDGFSETYETESKIAIQYCDTMKKQYNVDMNHTILFVTGHSLGATVAGQFAGMFENNIALRKNIFAYTFASPFYNTRGKSTKAFTNIHNIVNTEDAVPKFPLGGVRYGIDHTFKGNGGDMIGQHMLGVYLDGIEKNSFR